MPSNFLYSSVYLCHKLVFLDIDSAKGTIVDFLLWILCIQFFEHGSREQRKELADLLSGQMLTLSLQMYGCRVIQKVHNVFQSKMLYWPSF